MPVERERVIWTAIPAGTPDHPFRLSVAVSPRIEGKGRAKLSELTRFLDWPANVKLDELSVRVDGKNVAAKLVTEPKLVSNSSVWKRIFLSDLDVELVDLGEASKMADQRRIPIVPPTAQSTAVFKQVYRQRLAEQAGDKSAPHQQAFMTAMTNALSEQLREPGVDSWEQYLGNLTQIQDGTVNTAAITTASFASHALDLMRHQEMFHSRPPLAVYPAVVLDEREAGEGEPVVFQTLSNGVEGRGKRVLPRLSDTPVQTAFPVENPQGAIDAQNLAIDTQNLSSRNLFVMSALGDRVSGGGVGFMTRPGDSMEIVREETQWHCSSVVVQVQISDDGSVLYARHLYGTSGCSAIRFRLPASPSNGFSVTIRSLEPQTVEVDDHVSVKKYDLDRDGMIFRRVGSAWSVDNENREEFHRRIAMLRSYPALLRRLALIADFEVPADSLQSTGVVRVVPSHAAGKFDLCPWTNYFAQPGRLFLPANRPDTKTLLSEGLLSNDESRTRFKLIQLDGDTAAMKNLAQNRSKLLHEMAPSNVVDLEARGNPDEGGDLATLRQIGLALCDLEAINDGKEAVKRAQSIMKALCAAGSCPEIASEPEEPHNASIPLFAEDLLAGYRVDVRRREPNVDGPWRSLCAREGDYYFPGTATSAEASWQWPVDDVIDEGFISQTADEVHDSKANISGLRLSQAVFRWDGWSLVVPKPGEPMAERGSGLAAPQAEENDSTVRTRFKAKPGSLERLRFGHRYSFRLRAVDLAGNSLSVPEADTLTGTADKRDLRVFNSGCYERVEPLIPPIVVPFHKPGAGEGNDQIVIRAGDHQPRHGEWLLLPPGVSVPFVELHSALDGLVASDAWQLLREHDGSTPEWKKNSRGRADEWVEDGWMCRHGGFRVPYLPDPLVYRALFRQRDSRGTVAAVASVEMAQDRKNERYPDRITGRRIRLEAASSPRIRGGAHLEIGMPVGRIAKVQVATTPSDDDFSLFGLMTWCHCEETSSEPCDELEPAGLAPTLTKKELHAAACAGELGLITPARELTIVHAVEKPLIPAGHSNLAWVTDRKYRFGNPVRVGLGECRSPKDSGCAFDLTGDVWIDKPSTSKLDIRLRWNEPVDNPQFPDVFDEAHGLDPFHVAVPLDPADFVQFSDRDPDCGSAPPPAAVRCGLSETFPVAGKVRFEDGRHREVSLTFDATSRFVDFYDVPPRPPEGTPPNPEIALRFRRTSEPAIVHFPARIVPAPPEPIYMVPTFRQLRERRGKELHADRRGGLRIFLARNWFSSGSGEQLALVFAPTRTTPVKAPLDQYISVWGADPLWEPIEHDVAPYDRLATGLPIMPSRPLLDDVKNAENAIPSLVTPLLIVPPDSQTAVELDEVELSLASYTPRLDKQKNLWFVDVDLQAPTYFPFLRLGLARYQPYAEEGRHLSVLVSAVISQLVPDCTVSVVPAKKKRCYEVTVVMTASASFPEQPPRIDRTFEVLALRHRESIASVPNHLEDALPEAILTLVSSGDGEAKWRGIIDADEAGLCPQFIVVEKQTWADKNCRIVGCMEVR